jgi:hypothetical protein
VAEDWRLTVRLEDGVAEDVLASLREHAVEDAQKRLGGAVAVSADGPNLFAYADSREAVHDAESIISDLLREQGIQAVMAIHRWHDLEERWEDEDVPLPQTEAERQAEHERLEADEAAESQASGRALWEVRVELPSHHETRSLAHRLEKEGIPVIARWKFLVVGAESEDAAHELAEQLRAEAPAGAKLQVEPTGEGTDEVMRNPFAVFGGLADV